MFDRVRISVITSVSLLPKLIVACVLAGSAVIAADGESVFVDPTRPPAKKIVTPVTIQAEPVVEVIVETRRPKRVVKPKPKAKPLKLSSVLFSEHRRRAVINGRLVEEGHLVAGARVISISPKGVKVRRAGRTQTLTLVRASVKQRAISSQ